MLRDLLLRLQGRERLTLLTSDWARLFGAEVGRALEHQKLLEEAGAADYLPCPRYGGIACCRSVVPSPYKSSSYPFLALCGQEDAECEPREVALEDLAASTFSYPRFAVMLQRLLELEVELAQPTSALPETFRLGRRTWGGLEREVILTYSSLREAFPGFVSTHQASGQPALVLIPVASPQVADVLAAHGSGAMVEVRALSDLLEVAGGRIRLKAEYLLKDTRKNVAAPVVADAYCIATSRDGERVVNRKEYDRLAAQWRRFDLFVDLMAGEKAEVRRLEGKKHLKFQLMPSVARVIEKLVVARAAICLEHVLPDTHVEKALQRARQAIDPKVGGRWTWVVQLPGEKGKRARVQFKPPPSLRYLLLRPVPPAS